ncbi:M15 family metallopeptidase [Terrilactibacillus sp. S3-3]|nr:M15 family metallopeptidase [Terrilactibacillus sp. S3-3]
MKYRLALTACVLSAFFFLLSACSTGHQSAGNENHSKAKAEQASHSGTSKEQSTKERVQMMSAQNQRGVYTVAQPDSLTVLVNKHFALPAHYEPKDLVYPHAPFVFKEKLQKREMRKPAAAALEKMFAGAKKDGISLAGVSAYRSYATQAAVFNAYVKKDGRQKALTYSALPGTSEHETGLAIDVSGTSGKYAATPAFGKTKEAAWLAKHAQDYGFIIRYPKGKENITGYEYESWHLRYIGIKAAKKITKKGLTLEEYLHETPVSK